MSNLKKGEVFSLKDDLEKHLQLRFTYWRGCMIHNITRHTAAIFPNTDLEKVNYLKEQFLSHSDQESLDKLQKSDPLAITDPKIMKKIYELQYKMTVKLGQFGKTPGRTNPDRLRKIIRKDIDSFKNLVSERVQGKTVQDITKDSTDAKIWNHYIKPAREIHKAFGSDEYNYKGWELIFECFEGMAALVDNQYANSMLLISKENPTILLTKSDRLIQDGLSIYRPK